MSNITLTIPNDDHIALRAFGKALEEMALAHGAEPVQLQTYCNVTMNDEQNDLLRQKLKNVLGEPRDGDIDVTRAMVEQCAPIIDTTAQQVESLAVPVEANGATYETDLSSDNPQPVPVADSNGTPWDERIHSTSKALNVDGTWRLRRKPKDMDEAEWAALVESVKGKLHTQTPVMTDEEIKTPEPVAIEPTQEEVDDIEPPVTPPGDESWDTDRRPGSGGNGGVGVGESDDIEPPVTPPGDDFHTDAGVVTEQTVAGIPPLPVPPPVVVAPPVPEVTEWDFPRLMTFLTERHGKIDVTTVNALLAQDGIASLQELNAHPDKIGPFVARVKAHLGE
ncbi:TPA: hypothetical protein ACNBW6_003866 [Escherichia coli]